MSAADAREMADQLRRFAGDTAWRSQLAGASRALYEQAFTFESMLDRYAQLLGAALKEHARRAV